LVGSLVPQPSLTLRACDEVVNKPVQDCITGVFMCPYCGYVDWSGGWAQSRLSRANCV
jgi:hypothetical protein